MSPSFLTLPVELISNIVKSIESDESLCNLARCSRQLYDHTTPHLYHHISILEATEEKNGQLIRLASLLIRRPNLASFVRHFTLGGFKPLEPPGSSNLVAGELVWFDQAFGSIPNQSTLSDEEKLLCLEQFSPAPECPYDLILARLLPELVKVETIELNWRSIYDTSNLERMIGRAARREEPFDNQPPFKALKSMTFPQCAADAPSIARSATVLASLLRLPSIQSITGGFEGAGDIGPEKTLLDLKSASSPLTSLNLSAVKLSAAELKHLLRAPKALKNFTFSICPPIIINIVGIRRALEPQRRRLETLEIDDIESDIPLYGPMPSYNTFTSLRFLRAPALFFLSTNFEIDTNKLPRILPPRLSTLHLTRFHASFKSLLDALEHLISHKSPRQSRSLECLILDEEVAEDPRSDGDDDEEEEDEGPKLMEVLWKNTQETAINRLCRVAGPQGVEIHVIEDP